MDNKGTQQNIENSEIPEEVYLPSKKSRLIYIIFPVVLITTLAFNIPIKDIITKQLIVPLKSNRSCPIEIKSIDYSFFLPKIIFNNVKISKNCFGGKEDLKIPTLRISIDRPAIMPLGLKLSTLIPINNNLLNLYFILSPFKQIIKLEKSTINLNSLTDLMSLDLKLGGEIETEALLELQKGKINSINVLATSNNINILKSRIKGFEIPNISIGNLLLKMTGQEGKYNSLPIRIAEFKLGKELSIIQATSTGSVRFNTRIPNKSILDVETTLVMQKEFYDIFPIMNHFIPEDETLNSSIGKFKLSGILSRPKLESLK